MQKIELEFVARARVEVGSPLTIGETGEGLRRIIPILGGSIEGPRLNGEILAAGADYQLIRQDGFTTLDARYSARLDNGHMLYIVNVGIRSGSAETMAKITRGEPVDPADVYFRTTPSFETSSADHAWMSRTLFVASGARYPDRVDIDIYILV